MACQISVRVFTTHLSFDPDPGQLVKMGPDDGFIVVVPAVTNRTAEHGGSVQQLRVIIWAAIPEGIFRIAPGTAPGRIIVCIVKDVAPLTSLLTLAQFEKRPATMAAPLLWLALHGLKPGMIMGTMGRDQIPFQHHPAEALAALSMLRQTLGGLGESSR